MYQSDQSDWGKNPGRRQPEGQIDKQTGGQTGI